MKDNVRELFPGANTVGGFFSYFDNVIPKNVNRIFCLKGGPGVGKSSLMKKIAKIYIEKDYEVELFYCTSDPSSLDCVVIKDLGVVLLDATAPHVVDPKVPGAVDEIINLGDYWNYEELEKNKDDIKSASDDISRSFQRAYKYLKAAEPIYKDIEEKYSDCMDFGKINILSEKIISDLLKDVIPSEVYIKERNLFASAFTPIGHIDYTESALKGVGKIYHICGEIGTGKTTLLKKIYSRAKERGLSIEVYHYPMIPEKIETIIIKDLDTAFTTSDLFNEEETIDLNKYIDETRFRYYQEEVEYDKKVMKDLTDYALYNIKMAKEKHDVIEDYYVPNMNFEEVEKLKDKILERINVYDNR